jgi:hypothetical protein
MNTINIMPSRAYYKRLKQFKEIINNEEIQDYFSIPRTIDNFMIKVKVKNFEENKIMFEIGYRENYGGFIFGNIPIEISRIINSYTYNYIILNYIMLFNNDYPFHPFTWIMTSINTNYNYNSCMSYYGNKLYNYNDNLKKDWCLVNTIDKEILYLYTFIIGDIKSICKYFE